MVVAQLVRASNCILIAYGWETQMALDRASSHANFVFFYNKEFNFFLLILRNTNTLKVLQCPLYSLPLPACNTVDVIT